MHEFNDGLKFLPAIRFQRLFEVDKLSVPGGIKNRLLLAY
jgi:hypothetical protein